MKQTTGKAAGSGDQESIVYGCIKDSAGQDIEHRRVNRQAILSLPRADTFPFISQEMFTLPTLIPGKVNYQTEVIHFGASYQAIEYEWTSWIQQFEQLLRKMYWHSAVVHLETELAGVHTFHWDSNNNFHAPDSGDLRVRCHWVRERGVVAR